MNGWAERPARSWDYEEIPTNHIIVYASIKNYKIYHEP